MDKNVTVSVRALLTAGVLAVALLATYLLGVASGGGSAAHASTGKTAVRTAVKTATSSSDRTIDTSGDGTATAVPDEVGFSLEITETRGTVDAAFAAANAVTKRAVSTMEKYGVKAKDIQTSGISTYPVYSRRTKTAPSKLTGYRVGESLSVTVHGVKAGGNVISRVAVALGSAARLDGIQLEVSNPDKYLAEARDAAVAAAKAKAKQYAKDAGGSLGKIVTVREVPDEGSYGGGGYGYAAGATPGDAVAAPIAIESGQNTLSVSVEVVWLLS